jgi:[acyl-carrier-protein] S-malonyltransferase
VEEKLEKALEGIEIMDAVIPVIANVTATEETRSDLINGNLVKQVSRPVLWEESVKRMIELGADTFVEIGPGKTLTGFVKKIDKGVRVLNIENLESLNNALLELEGVKC